MKRLLVAWLRHHGLLDITQDEVNRAARIAALSGLATFIFPAIAIAQSVNIDLGTGAGLTDRVIQLAGALIVIPSPCIQQSPHSINSLRQPRP